MEDREIVLPVPQERRIVRTGRKQYGRVVFEEDFVYPDGHTETFFLFGTAKDPSIVFPVTASGEVIAVEQYRHGICDIVTEVPGGNPNGDETGLQVALNELREETGFVPERTMELPWIYPDPSSFRVKFLLYCALGCRKACEPKRDATESMRVCLVPIDRWIEMIHDGKIRDAKTIAITMLSLPFVKK